MWTIEQFTAAVDESTLGQVVGYISIDDESAPVAQLAIEGESEDLRKRVFALQTILAMGEWAIDTRVKNSLAHDSHLYRDGFRSTLVECSPIQPDDEQIAAFQEELERL